MLAKENAPAPRMESSRPSLFLFFDCWTRRRFELSDRPKMRRTRIKNSPLNLVPAGGSGDRILKQTR
ncbi:unnamed protein product [Linum trigynum]|uniref:Uncharacterized protein n=1 Tax=Linum trigynum TaxID=586398 RepID=A0AAV2DY77_9ROSI